MADGTRLARIVIENVSPELDGGRHAVKRLLGDTLLVEADVFKDGHELLACRVRYRRPGTRGWRFASLEYRYDPDRWTGSLVLDQIGRWSFTIEAWPDLWRTWREELRKRLDVAQAVDSELLEGAELLRRAAETKPAKTREAILEAAERLGEESSSPEEREAAAFSEQLGELMTGPIEGESTTTYHRLLEVVVDRPRASFGAWYELFPRSQSPERGRPGTLADTERRLPELAELGFDVVYLPPIHPIGYAHRKGRNNTPVAQPGDPGSPWAIGAAEGGHTAVHPELGTLADFEHLVEAAAQHGLEIALDYALQCSPDHPWAKEHPEWFFIRPDRTIRYAENPPKKYQDIYPLNFWCEEREALWNACRDVLLFWIERGVKIFRVDNPHTKPMAFWEWVIAEVKTAHPDVIFLAEAFTRPKRMKYLAKIGFTQSYTHFTWKNTSWELREFMTEVTQGETAEYYRPNFFANTPDILHEYLQRGGHAAFRIRLVLAATLSPTYGIYSGYELCENVPVRPGSEEYLDSEKYQVRWRDWNARGHIKDDIRKLNRIRRESPALQRLTNLELLPADNEQILFYRKSTEDEELLIAVNLDPHGAQESMVHVPARPPGEEVFTARDLLTDETYRWQGGRNYVRLDPDRVAHILRVEPAPTGSAR